MVTGAREKKSPNWGSGCCRSWKKSIIKAIALNPHFLRLTVEALVLEVTDKLLRVSKVRLCQGKEQEESERKYAWIVKSQFAC